MINVALIDDHVVVRSGFAQLLSLEEDIRIVGQFDSAAQAWPHLLRDPIDVAVLDIAMPDESGLSLLQRLRQQRPPFAPLFSASMTPMPSCKARLMPGPVVISPNAVAPMNWCRRCAPSAAAGFTCARMPYGHCAILRSHRKNCRYSRRAKKRSSNLLVNGLSVKTIAQQLTLSHKTVQVHRANILGKLHCDTTVELVHFALQHQLLAGS